MTINALLLIDGVASHGHQSRGLVCELARHAEVNVEEFFVQMHSNWMRGYLRKALSMSSQQTLDWAGHCFSWQQDQYSVPDLIISAGEETKLLNAVLAKRFACDNIYIGRQHGVRSSWYNAVLTLDEPVLPNAVSMNLPPSRLSPDGVSEAFAAYLEEGGDHRDNYWGMILGGDKGACQYTDDDWQNLAQAMNALAKKNKIKWLVLTTRFTSKRATDSLLAGVKSRYLESINSYSQRLDDPLPLLAARTQRIYCSFEQLPILFDVIASGCPAIALMPELAQPNRQIRQFFSVLRQERLLSVASIAELAEARMARPARPLPDLLKRKRQQLFEQWSAHCPGSIIGTQRH